MPQRKEECTNPLSENKFLYGIMSVENISRGDGDRSGYILFAHYGGNTFGIVDACLRRALAEGGGSNLVFGDENPDSALGWTRHHRRKCGFA